MRYVTDKIVIDNKIIEEVNSFNYLGNMVSYEKRLDIDKKLHNCLKITGIINNVLGHKETQENKNKIIQYTGPPSIVIW